MKYMLSFNSPEEFLDRDLSDPHWADYRESWRSYMEAIYAAGIVRSGEVLKPPCTWSSVRHRDGERQVQDGPLPEVRELLGGFLIIEVDTLDEALLWAGRSPSSEHGSTDVKPVAAIRLD
jgi:hypothetical protein